MLPLLFAAFLGLVEPPVPAPAASPAPAPAPAPAPIQAAEPAPPQTPAPLSFVAQAFPFTWDRIIPMDLVLDGLKVEEIFFNKRQIESRLLRFLKDADFGTRAQVKVTNTSRFPRIPGFAVAVLDENGGLLGVASGGTRVGTIKPGETETFDLSFTQVNERLPKGVRFLLAIELRN